MPARNSSSRLTTPSALSKVASRNFITCAATPPVPGGEHPRLIIFTQEKLCQKKQSFTLLLHKVRSEGKPRKTYGAMETIIRTDLLSCADRSYSRSRGLPRRLGASDGSNRRRRERRQRSRLAQRRDQGHSNRHRRGADRSIGRGRALRASQSSARAVHGRSSAVGLPHIRADWNRASGQQRRRH